MPLGRVSARLKRWAHKQMDNVHRLQRFRPSTSIFRFNIRKDHSASALGGPFTSSQTFSSAGALDTKPRPPGAGPEIFRSCTIEICVFPARLGVAIGGDADPRKRPAWRSVPPRPRAGANLGPAAMRSTLIATHVARPSPATSLANTVFVRPSKNWAAAQRLRPHRRSGLLRT